MRPRIIGEGVATALRRRAAKAGNEECASTQRSGYIVHKMALPFENRFQRKIRIEMIRSQPVTIEKR
jgi:hypothetical protein